MYSKPAPSSCLPQHLGQRGAGVVVLAGVYEGVVVCGAADAACRMSSKFTKGSSLVHLIGGE